MNKFIFLCQNLEITKSLVKIGVVPISVTRSMSIYDFFTKQNNKSKMICYENTAFEFKIESRQVMNIVKDMETIID